jgi:hypothetical protein
VTKRVWLACLALLAMSAQAAPITFFDVQFDVAALAETDGPAAFDSDSSPPSAAPVVVSAASIGTTDIATAGAVAGSGLLSASADVSGTGGVVSGTATSHFSGSFLNTGPTTLNIAFTPLDSEVGSGSGLTTLFVTLTSGATTLFQDFIGGSQQFSFDLAAGTTILLDLTLSSEARAGFPTQGAGNASSLGLVSFDASVAGSVPSPATWLLVAIGLAAMSGRRYAHA